MLDVTADGIILCGARSNLVLLASYVEPE